MTARRVMPSRLEQASDRRRTAGPVCGVSLQSLSAFGRDRVILGPPVVLAGTPLRVDGQDVNYWMVSAHGTLFNYTGHPAVVLPFKLDRDGLPIGVQLVGKRWNESGLLAIAKALSPVTGEFRRPPGY